MQDSFARARTRPSARATIGYLVYKKQTNYDQKYSMEHNLELMVCSLSGLIVAPAFQSVISTIPQTTGQKLLITMP